MYKIKDDPIKNRESPQISKWIKFNALKDSFTLKFLKEVQKVREVHSF